MDIRTIQNKVMQGRYVVSFTHTERIRIRKIDARNIEEAIGNGIIIEAYLNDPRGQSCLILGVTKEGRPLHIVCGNLNGDDILIVTAYEPDILEWDADWKTRRK